MSQCGVRCLKSWGCVVTLWVISLSPTVTFCRLVTVVTMETYVMSRFKPLIISDMRADVTL